MAHEIEHPGLSLPSSSQEARGHGEVPGSASGPAVSPEERAVGSESDEKRLPLVQNPDGTVAGDFQIADHGE